MTLELLGNWCQIDSKRVPIFTRMGERQVWNHKKKRFGTCVRESEKRSTISCLEKLDFSALAYTESLFSLLPICSIGVRLCGQKPSKLSHMAASTSAKMELKRSQKTCEKCRQKSVNICPKCRPKGGSQKVVFSCFFEYPPPDGLQGVPWQAPKHKNTWKSRPRDAFSEIWLA